MIHSVALGVEMSIHAIDIAMTVLDSAIEQVSRVARVRPENNTDRVWIEEVEQLGKMLDAVGRLMADPQENLADIRDAAYQLAKEDKARAEKGGVA